MSAVVDLLNRWGATFATLAGVALWQATLVAIVVAIIAFALRRSSPAVRYWLWQLVAIKLLLLPLGSWSVGLAWLPAPKSEILRSEVVLELPQIATPVVATVAESDVQAFSETPSSAPSVDAAPIADVAPITAGPQPLSAPSQLAGDVSAQPPLIAEQSPRVVEFFAVNLTWQAWLLLGWATVVAVQIIRLLVQRRRLAQMLQETSPGGVELVATVNQIAAQLMMRRPPAVSVTQLDCSPFACGIWWPRVVVPASLLVELDAVQLKQVLAHELAHLKRRDLVWGWITELARLLYFFNPAMLIAARRVRLERELACDQIAMQLSGRGPAEYAETLVRVLSSAAVSSAFRTAAASLDGGQRGPRGREAK